MYESDDVTCWSHWNIDVYTLRTRFESYAKNKSRMGRRPCHRVREKERKRKGVSSGREGWRREETAKVNECSEAWASSGSQFSPFSFQRTHAIHSPFFAGRGSGITTVKRKGWFIHEKHEILSQLTWVRTQFLPTSIIINFPIDGSQASA